VTRVGTSLATARLLLHPFNDEDAQPLFEIMCDARSMRYTYVAPSLAHCQARLSAYEAQRVTLGFAPWVVRLRTTGELIGWGGLSLDPDEPEWGLEVSYALAPGSWGQGYATELVQFAVAHAFAVLSAQEVHAFAKPDNAASLKVLSKSGFALLRHEARLQRDHFLIRAPAPAPTMLTSITIRPIQRDDLTQWRPLWDGYNAFYGREGPSALPEAITAATWERFFAASEPVHALVAVEGNQVVALVHYLFLRSTTRLNDVCYLQDLFTDPSHRGRGLGRHLIEAVYEAARKEGASRVYWHTRSDNAVARALYDKVAKHWGVIVYSHEIQVFS
jgi:RimJ/RimL family protein N-acetyltransferase